MQAATPAKLPCARLLVLPWPWATGAPPSLQEKKKREEAGGAVMRSSVALAGVAPGQACAGDTRSPARSGHPDPTKERADALQALSNPAPPCFTA